MIWIVDGINLSEWILILCFTIFCGMIIILMINVSVEVWDYVESHELLPTLNSTKDHQMYDDRVIEEIWIKNRNSKHFKLILPPACVKKLTSNGNGRDRSSSIISIQNTKRIVKKLYKATLGRKESSDNLGKSVSELLWELDIPQFQYYSSFDLPGGCTPLLCFINSRSGGQQGIYYKEQLLKLLNPYQVVDLSVTKSPLVVLKEFSKLPAKVKILVCGGDGTISWILDSIDQIPLWNDEEHIDRKPEVAILPIGTGNDLANELGWLDIHENHVMSGILQKVQSAQPCHLDRWKLVLSKQKPSQSSSSSAKSGREKNKEKDKDKEIKHFQNYFGIGVDAQIVLQFHVMRNSNPNLFFHKYINKLFYGIMGWQEIWRQSCESLPTSIELFYKGKKVDLPPDTQGIVFLNIASYGGGSILWREGLDTVVGSMDTLFMESYDADHHNDIAPPGLSETGSPMRHNEGARKVYKKVAIDDGLLEVVAVKSSFELAQVKLGITSCQKLLQGDAFEVVVHKAIPMQIDGEPWIQNPGKISLSLLFEEQTRKALMCRPVPSEANIDLLIECLEKIQNQQVITKFQTEKILKEYVHLVQHNYKQ